MHGIQGNIGECGNTSPPACPLIEIVWFLVMVIVVPFLSLVVHLPDAWIGVLGGASRTASSIMYGCVTSPELSWLMWMGKVGTEYCISVLVVFCNDISSDMRI